MRTPPPTGGGLAGKRTLVLAGLVGAIGVVLAVFGAVQLSASGDDRDAADALAAERDDLEAEADDRLDEVDTVLGETEGLALQAADINDAATAVDDSLDAIVDSFRETKDEANVLVDCENEAIDANSFSTARSCYALLLDGIVSTSESGATATDTLATDIVALEEVTS